jgi:hypothetical protein
LENERYKFWGLFMKMFINFEFWKKKFHQKWYKNFEKPIFCKIFHINLIFYVKFELRMFSAFILYTYCPHRSKMTNFQKL